MLTAKHYCPESPKANQEFTETDLITNSTTDLLFNQKVELNLVDCPFIESNVKYGPYQISAPEYTKKCFPYKAPFAPAARRREFSLIIDKKCTIPETANITDSTTQTTS